MNLKTEILNHVDQLAPDMQERVLRFIRSLSPAAPQGETGAALRAFAGSLDALSSLEMTQAIDEECEQVDTSDW